MSIKAFISLFTFIIGLIGSIGLIIYGNNKYATENKITGIFFIFIALIQLMDFLLLIDLKNKIGINKIVSVIGPLLNIGQPLILYLIKLIFYNKDNIEDIFSLLNYNFEILLVNLYYFISLVINYIKYLNNSTLQTIIINGLLIWPWIIYFSSSLYLLLLAINIFYLFPVNYGLILFSVIFLSLLLSKMLFKSNIVEMWCYFGTFIPFIMIILTNIKQIEFV